MELTQDQWIEEFKRVLDSNDPDKTKKICAIYDKLDEEHWNEADGLVEEKDAQLDPYADPYMEV
jgi:hypothetical protein